MVSNKWGSARSYFYGRKKLTEVWRSARLALSCSLTRNDETSTFVLECLGSKYWKHTLGNFDMVHKGKNASPRLRLVIPPKGRTVSCQKTNKSV